MNAPAKYTTRDHVIRKMLESTAVPDELKDRILAKQLAHLQALKDQLTPGWREQSEPPVEIPTVAVPFRGLDGMVRRGDNRPN